MEFEVDKGRIYEHAKPIPVQTTILGFDIDDSRGAQASKRELIIDHLLNGWGLRKWEPHSVVGWRQVNRFSKKRGNIDVQSVEASDLPTPQTIEGAFNCSLSNAYLVLKELKCRLNLHQIDRVKRSQRGDALTRHFRQQKAMQVTLNRFFLVWRRIENKERRIRRRPFKE